jgi:hypothetical protein
MTTLPRKGLINTLYKKIVAPDQRYYDALGRFVDAFATAEGATQLVLWYYAKLPTSVALALLSGIRGDEVLNRMRRLFETGDVQQSDWADLEPILQQFNLINGIRNEILHYGARAKSDGERYVSNALKAHTRQKITVFSISAEILADMTHDVGKIIIHLHTRHMGRPPLGGARNLDEVEKILRAPWRYKPPLRRPVTSPKRDAKSRVRKGRPKSSPE